MSLKSPEHRHSARQSKVKRLDGSFSPKSYKSFFSYSSPRPMTPIHIPKMSKQSLKRWLDARDAYLGHNYPYIQERLERRRRRRQRRRKTKPNKNGDNTIDYECAVSIFSIGSDGFSVPELTPSGKQRRLSRKDSRTKTISHSETNLRRKGGLLERIKSFVQAPVRSLSCLTLRKPSPPKRTQIIHDHFDDKCVGTEISERKSIRTNIERKEQTTQANIPRPQIKLHHEFDSSMVVGEKKQRIRSVRRDVEYRDKATETDFILNFAIDEKERREGEENKVEDDDKTTRPRIKKKETDSHQEQHNAEQEQHPLPSMSANAQRKKRRTDSEQAKTSTNTGNRIVPLTDLSQPSTNDDKQNGSELTIQTSTESNASTHEQLLRYAKRRNINKSSYIIKQPLLFHFSKRYAIHYFTLSIHFSFFLSQLNSFSRRERCLGS